MKYLLNLINFLCVNSIDSMNYFNGFQMPKEKYKDYVFPGSRFLCEPNLYTEPYIKYQEPCYLVHESYPVVTLNYLPLPVDHFDNTNKDIWFLKCLQNAQFWMPGSSIFLIIGGNEPLVPNVLIEGLIFELVSEIGGTIFAAEHRYYGESKTHEDLSFLTSEQALEDFSALIQELKREPRYFFSRVVVVGGGYGGSLAVWLKQLYPDLVDVVVASGAPLLAKANFQNYLRQVVIDYEEHVPQRCLRKIKRVFDYYNCCLNKSDVYECLHSYSPICKLVNMNKKENQILFIQSEISFLSVAAERGVKAMSDTCTSVEVDSFDTVRRGARLFWNERQQCFDYDFEEFRAKLNEEEEYKDTKHWLWQCCNEFGFFQTTSGLRDPYTNNIPLKHYYHICSELFGDDYNDEIVNATVKKTNKRYGGLKPNVTNTIFVYGELDPWKSLGVVKNCFPNKSNNKIVLIPEASHCEDLMPRDITDSKHLITGRMQVKLFVKTLLLVPC